MEAKEKGRVKDQAFYFTRNCRDDDLILLSQSRLDLKGKQDIK